MNISLPTRLRIIGVISIIEGIAIVAILRTEMLGMLSYRGGESTFDIIVINVITLLWGLLFIIAGLSSIFLQKPSEQLYGAVFIVTVTYIVVGAVIEVITGYEKMMLVFMLNFFAMLFLASIPFVISLLGIIFSRQLKQSKVRD